MTVTATVRVQSETLTIGDNCRQFRCVMSLRRACLRANSPTRFAVNDGVGYLRPGRRKREPRCWSNYAYAREGNTTSSITNYNSRSSAPRAAL